MYKNIYFFFYIIYLNLNKEDDCLNLNIKEIDYITAANVSSIYFLEKKEIDKNVYYNKKLTNFLINIFLLKIIKLKTFKNYNIFLKNLNMNIKDLDFFINILNLELFSIENNLNYYSELFLKINLTYFSLNHLIFMQSKSVLEEKYELNVFASFILNHFNLFLNNLKKETLDLEINSLSYVLINLKEVSELIVIIDLDLKYYNFFFCFYFSDKNYTEILIYFKKIIKNLNLILSIKKKIIKSFTKNIRVKFLNEFQEEITKDSDLTNISNILLKEDFLLEKNNIFLNEKLKFYISKKIYIYIKKICSLHLIFVSDYSYILLKINIMYNNKYVVEYGNRYWSNTALNLIFFKKLFFEKVLININLNSLEKEENLDLKSYYFIKHNFYIKKNENSNLNSIFCINSLNTISQKFLNKNYFIDKNIFLNLLNIFEDFLILNENLNLDINLKSALNLYKENIEKINNFNFFNLENTITSEKEKYYIFYNLIIFYTKTYINYLEKNVLYKNFLSYFFINEDIEILIEFITNEKDILKNILNLNIKFIDFELLIKTLKNINLFLNVTYEININDISNNNYTSNYFIKIEYFEYIFFIKNLKKLIEYSEQMITIQNLKKQILKNNSKENFGIEFKLDFRGRLYALDTYKAYDNSKLIRNSIKLDNNFKLKNLKNWYLNIWKKTNIFKINDLNYELYNYIFTKKEFYYYKILLDINLTIIKDHEFLDLLYLKTYISSLMYVGFLILKKDEKKQYTLINILETGYNFYFYNINNNNEELTIEETLELKETKFTIKNLLLNKKKNLKNLLNNNKMLTLDSSCNGYTHLLFTFSELEEEIFNNYLKKLNLTNDENNYDFYTEVLNDIKNDEEVLKTYINNKQITRNTIKKVIMTIPYNAKEFSFKKKLEENLNIDNIEEKKDVLNVLKSYFSKKFKNKIINNNFSQELKLFLKKKEKIHIWYIIDNDTKINLTYLKKKDVKISFILNNINKKKSIYITELTEVLDIEKTITAAIANIIHANDSYILKKLIKNIDLNILTIHDCVKFDSFLFEEILLLYELIFTDFYHDYNIYEKIFYTNNTDTQNFIKVFDLNKKKKFIYNKKKEKCKYILKF